MPLSRALAVTLLLSVGSATALSQSAPPPPSSAGPMRVTTDTPEYCETLADRVQRAQHIRPSAEPEAEELAEEGHSMCHAGLIRGGLVRLRRALMLLRQQ
jgi:hypothetical protein